MSNLSIALAMILATETPNMDCKAAGDLHLPPERRAFGRFQIRKPVLEDMREWTGLAWNRADSMNPTLDIGIAAMWLKKRAGKQATVKRLLSTWNGGRQGRTSPDALAYVRKCYRIRQSRPEHYARCQNEIRKAGIQ